VKTSFSRSSALACAMGLVAVLVSGCVVPGDVDAGDGVGYYQPYVGAATYSAWGGGFEVAPGRGGNDRSGSGNNYGSSNRGGQGASTGNSRSASTSTQRGTSSSGGGHAATTSGNRPTATAYHPAAANRSAPSIPTSSRSAPHKEENR
jgi:hypothetical protein